MKKFTVAVLMFTAFAFVVNAEAKVWDMEKFFPGDLAPKYDLMAADGQKLVYSFFGGGAFGRVVDGRGTDYQFWGDQGMYYFGWFWQEPGQPLESFWTVPFNLNIPRWYDDGGIWTTTYSDVVVHMKYDDATTKWDVASLSTSEIVTVEIRQEWLAGEWTILMRGGVSGAYEERWWLSQCIPIQAQGFHALCAPGVRQVQMLDGSGKTTFERRFEAWVPKK